MLNERFVELTKAYKTLTDEEIRNNYIQFGHPDGKQSFSIGIALPKFIVTEGNGKFVLLLYGILFGVLLPYTVGRWWYGNQRYTKDNVLVASAGNLFREYKPGLTGGDMIGTMSVGDEYTELLNGDHAHSGLAKIEKKILESVDMSPKDKLALSKLDDERRRKALALLWAYLGRVDLEDNTLNNGRFMLMFLQTRPPDIANPINLHRKVPSRTPCRYPQQCIHHHCPGFRQPSTYHYITLYIPKPHSSYCTELLSASSASLLYP